MPGGHIDDQEALRGVEIDWVRHKVVEDAEYDGKGPSSIRNERVDETNVLHRGTRSGGHVVELEASKVVEGDRDSANVVEDAAYDGKRPESIRNEHGIDTNALRPDRRSRGQIGEKGKAGGVETDRRRESDGKYILRHGKWCRKDGATSDARRKSKRLEARSLAADKSSQQELDRHTKRDVPESSQLPSNHPRGPTESIGPPRHRGRLKSPTRKIRRSKRRRSTYRAVQPRRGQSERIECIGNVVYSLQMLGKYPTATTKQRDRPRTIGRGHLQQRDKIS